MIEVKHYGSGERVRTYECTPERQIELAYANIECLMTIDEAIEMYTSNAEYERTHSNLQGCLEFRQLAEWLRDYKRLKEQEPCEDAISRQAVLDLIADYDLSMGQVVRGIHALPSVKPQESCDVPDTNVGQKLNWERSE